MFIAHLPASYLLGHYWAKHLPNTKLSAQAVIAACLIGGLLPDLDMVYFYLIDHQQTHHHKYFTHWPVLWAGLLLVGLFITNLKTRLLWLAACASALLHMVLDSVVGDIWWFAPFIDKPFAFATVTRRVEPWWLNFVLHWSFALELALCIWAGWVYRVRAKERCSTPKF